METPSRTETRRTDDPILVIGAGIGGLCTALRLVHEGHEVEILERHDWVGGKIRQKGGIDCGPTVLTMRHVFDRLMAHLGEDLEDHVTLYPQDILARHWWPDGSTLDLHADPQRNAAAIEAFAGARARAQFEVFGARCKRLFSAFRAPMMESAEPDALAMTAMVARQPALLSAMAPHRTLQGALQGAFDDPRLRQLFGRYATYVGGSPYQAPALLSLIWQAEANGVWVVDGGMHALARALARLIEARGGRIRTNAHVARILSDRDGVTGVALESGETLPARRVVFNGDPRALSLAALGPEAQGAVPASRTRSLSAHVWAFGACATGLPLAHHNVFFCADPEAEFEALRRGGLPDETTLYLCAEDRGQARAVTGHERFEIILNAPPLTRRAAQDGDHDRCHQRTFPPLARFGLRFSPEPGPEALTTPAEFDTLFPQSAGSLYGQSPHGTFSALNRPRARTRMAGLYLCGGGCHPGAGVPMAALSGQHAAEAILTDRTSTSPSRRTATPGGTWMRSPIAARARSPSSGS